MRLPTYLEASGLSSTLTSDDFSAGRPRTPRQTPSQGESRTKRGAGGATGGHEDGAGGRLQRKPDRSGCRRVARGSTSRPPRRTLVSVAAWVPRTEDATLMSRGPGKITRGITVALAAAPVRDIGPVPVTYRELAAMIFGTDAPTRSQRVSVGRPARRLEAAGEADLWNVPRVAERSRAELWYVEKVDVRGRHASPHPRGEAGVRTGRTHRQIRQGCPRAQDRR
jgi:hypothetical protein